MKFQEYIYLFITSIGGTSAILLIAAFLGRSLLSHKFNESIEKLKSKLSIVVHEKTTKITRFDKDKTDAIKKIHFSIADLENHAVSVFIPFINIRPSLDVILQGQCDMGNEFISFHKKVVNFQYELELYSIYLDSSFVNEINEAVKTLKQNTYDTVLHISAHIKEMSSKNENEQDIDFLRNSKENFENSFNQTFYPLRIKLIDAFRNALSY